MSNELIQLWFLTPSTDKRLRLIEQMQQEGVSLDLSSEDGKVMLARACAEANAVLVKVLVNAGADLECASAYDGQPLANAVFGRSMQLCQYLLDRGAHPDSRDENGELAFFKALGSSPGLAKMILNAGANIHLRDLEGNTPLMACAQMGRLDCLRLLLEKGAEVDARSEEGATALMMCCDRRDIVGEKMAGLLLNAGADPNLQTPDGCTALMNAASLRGASNGSLIKRLLRAGADPMIQAQQPGSGVVRALHLAQAADNRAAMKLLLDAEHAHLAQNTPQSLAKPPARPRL